MKRLICMILSLAMLLSVASMLSGCNSDAKKIVGTWKAEVDITEMFTEGFEKELKKVSQDAASFFKFKEYTLTFVITFHKDGTYVRNVDTDSLDALIDKITVDVRKGLERFFTDLFKKQGLIGDVDILLLQRTGKTFDMLVRELTTTLNESREEMETKEEGRYVVQKDMIFFSLDKETDPDGTNYDTFTMYNDTLILQTCFCQVKPEEKEYNDRMYPMVFKKQAA